MTTSPTYLSTFEKMRRRVDREQRETPSQWKGFTPPLTPVPFRPDYKGSAETMAVFPGRRFEE